MSDATVRSRVRHWARRVRASAPKLERAMWIGAIAALIWLQWSGRPS